MVVLNTDKTDRQLQQAGQFLLKAIQFGEGIRCRWPNDTEHDDLIVASRAFADECRAQIYQFHTIILAMEKEDKAQRKTLKPFQLWAAAREHDGVPNELAYANGASLVLGLMVDALLNLDTQGVEPLVRANSYIVGFSAAYEQVSSADPTKPPPFVGAFVLTSETRH